MDEQRYECGMIGLGTMGRNLVYNLCDRGYSVAGFDKDLSKVNALEQEKGNYRVFGARDAREFVKVLKTPRVILLLVPAGPVVDAVISELMPLVSKDDIIVDCGNSHFTDTDRRISQLAGKGPHFMGAGVSGGESGARYGPSIMPGGEPAAYRQIAPMLEAVAAKVGTDPCVTFIGPGSAGHYVKMVHNGIEYALMQVIAESYHLLKEIACMSNEELHKQFLEWNEGPLQSYLVGITAEVFARRDDLTPNFLVDMILDSAGQKGTGKWMSQNAMDLQVPIPAIDGAVSARDLSGLKDERSTAAGKLKGPTQVGIKDKDSLLTDLGQALHFSMITTFAQGFSLLHHASAEYKYDLKLDEVAKIWRGGCIIRSALLEPIRSGFEHKPGLLNLMLDPDIAEVLGDLRDGIVRVVRTASDNGIPAPVFMASLAYYDGYRQAWLPSSLIQAQRDLFGAHTYRRTDRDGVFHTDWNINS